MDHSLYDKRNYPIVDVQTGYGEWVNTYEQIVQDEMDVRLLDRVTSIDWSGVTTALDFACGTGRIGAWLKARSAAAIDGVDITPEMLAVAQTKGIYRTLHTASVTDTGYADDAYDLGMQSLADEHLPDLLPLYRETARVIKPGGHFVLVGYHPYFLIAGIPTHFNRASGENVTIRSYVHLFSHHVESAHASGWALREMHEGLIDAEWLQKKPKWEKYLGLPISFVLVWQRTA